MTASISRADLELLQGMTPKLLRFFEGLFANLVSVTDTANGAIASTGSIQDATVLTLSPNTAFNNERVLTFDLAQFQTTDSGPGNELLVELVSFILLNGGYKCTFNLRADTNLNLRDSGTVPSSIDGPYASDAAAATAGIQIGEWYAKTGGTVVWRQV